MQTEENYAQLKVKSYTTNNLWKVTLEAITKNTTGMNAGPFHDENKLSC